MPARPTYRARKNKAGAFVWLAPAGLPAVRQAMRRLECWRVVPSTSPDASMEDAEHVTIVGEIYGHERHADGTGYEASVSPEQAAAEGAVVKSLNGNSFLLGAPATYEFLAAELDNSQAAVDRLRAERNALKTQQPAHASLRRRLPPCPRQLTTRTGRLPWACLHTPPRIASDPGRGAPQPLRGPRRAAARRAAARRPAA